MQSEDHQLHTTSGQECPQEKRPEVAPPPFRSTKEGRLTARELSRRRRQRLQQRLQQPAKPQAE